MSESFNRSEIDKVLASNKGDPVFAKLAEFLRSEAKYLEAVEVCLAGLSANPVCHKGRLVLARTYFDMSYIPFCIRELEHLNREIPKNTNIVKLLRLISPNWVDSLNDSKNTGKEGKLEKAEMTLAETDFDIDLISEDSDNKDK